MNEVVLVDALRTPIGKRNGGLSASHAIDLLGAVQREVTKRSGIDPTDIGQVVGGCVGQVGMQSTNITRTSWLAAGLPETTACTTVDAQCGSSQQAATLAFCLVAAGVVDVAVACGVELMSRVPMGSTIPKDPDVGKPVNRTYRSLYEWTSQFEGAERIARKWGITRDDCDNFAKLSQDRAAAAWEAAAFSSQLVEVEVPSVGEHPDGARTCRIAIDEGPRPTSLEGLAGLKPTLPNGIHTAGSSSQIADGAAAALLMNREVADSLGLVPLATIVDVCTVGCDPVLMLEGPVPATSKLLNDNGLAIGDIDVVEINEAFASVVLAWERQLSPDMERVNPNGGAIALGHPLGATGVGLIAKAAHELARRDGEHALVTMCCGGGLGTGTLLRRMPSDS